MTHTAKPPATPPAPTFERVSGLPLAIFDAPQLRALEVAALAAVTAVASTPENRAASPMPPTTADSAPHPLMAAAGRAAADFILAQPHTAPRVLRVWCFAGPGNNGGDALYAATCLHKAGVDVQVCLPQAPADKPALAAARWAHCQAGQAGVPIQPSMPAPDDWQSADWLLDGLFGIGLSRPLEGVFADIAQALNTFRNDATRTPSGLARRPDILALDIPSGLSASNGSVLQDSAHAGRKQPAALAVEASHTLSFLAPARGLFTGRGPDHSGTVWLARLITLPAQAHPQAPATEQQTHAALNTPAAFMPTFPRRRPSSHKGHFGSLAIVGGDHGTCGAVILAARAALFTGAGRVHAALIGSGGPVYDAPHPEIMIRDFDRLALDTMTAFSIGPGLGQSGHAATILRQVLQRAQHNVPLLLDADALNLIARDPLLQQQVRDGGRQIVMTPHPAEAARLLGIETRDIEADRPAALHRLCQRYGCTVVLKGAGTLIGAPGETLMINTNGNTGLSSGGTGDVLSGVTGAMLAQHLPPFQAALAAVFLHGLAADTLSDDGVGPAGLSAGELAPAMRRGLNGLLQQYGKIN